MTGSKVDGAVFVPELREDAVLRSDLIGRPVHGRADIADVMAKLERLYVSQAVTYDRRAGRRDIRGCQAVLSTGDSVQIVTVALRDDAGWVCELHVSHIPHRAARRLARQVLGGGGD